MSDKILVIGSLNMDLAINLEYMPLVGETILGKDLKYNPGGKGANQAMAIAKLGGNVSILGSIGDDSFGRLEAKTLKEASVDISHLKISKEIPTGTAIIYIDKNANNNIVVIPSANKLCDIDYINENISLIEEADFIVMQMEIPYETIQYVAKVAKEKSKVVILNPAPVIKVPDEDLLSNITYLTPNETELMKLTNMPCNTIEEIKLAGKSLIEKGVKNIVVTLGEKGSLYISEDESIFCPALKVDSVDTTAAGDCFNGAFILSLANGKEIKDAIEFASKAAAITVTKKGAMSSIPTKKEVDDFEFYK